VITGYKWELYDVTKERLEYYYDVPFRLAGKLDKLTFELGPRQMTAAEEKIMAVKGNATTQRANRATSFPI